MVLFIYPLTYNFSGLHDFFFTLFCCVSETRQPEHQADEFFHLKLLSRPVSTTIALFDDDILLVDPSHEEEVWFYSGSPIGPLLSADGSFTTG